MILRGRLVESESRESADIWLAEAPVEFLSKIQAETRLLIEPLVLNDFFVLNCKHNQKK